MHIFTRLIYPFRPFLHASYISFFLFLLKFAHLSLDHTSISYLVFVTHLELRRSLFLHTASFFRPFASALSFLTLFGTIRYSAEEALWCVKKENPTGRKTLVRKNISRDRRGKQIERGTRRPEKKRGNRPSFRCFAAYVLSLSYLYSSDRRLTPVKYYNYFRLQGRCGAQLKRDTARKTHTRRFRLFAIYRVRQYSDALAPGCSQGRICPPFRSLIDHLLFPAVVLHLSYHS